MGKQREKECRKREEEMSRMRVIREKVGGNRREGGRREGERRKQRDKGIGGKCGISLD